MIENIKFRLQKIHEAKCVYYNIDDITFSSHSPYDPSKKKIGLEWQFVSDGTDFVSVFLNLKSKIPAKQEKEDRPGQILYDFTLSFDFQIHKDFRNLAFESIENENFLKGHIGKQFLSVSISGARGWIAAKLQGTVYNADYIPILLIPTLLEQAPSYIADKDLFKLVLPPAFLEEEE